MDNEERQAVRIKIQNIKLRIQKFDAEIRNLRNFVITFVTVLLSISLLLFKEFQRSNLLLSLCALSIGIIMTVYFFKHTSALIKKKELESEMASLQLKELKANRGYDIKNHMKVFMSFGYEDSNIARQLIKGLEQNGYEVFRRDPDLSENINDRILDFLSKTDVVIGIVSDSSRNNKLVNSELMISVGYHKENKKPLIIPVVLGDYDNIPDYFRDFNCIVIQSLDNENEIESAISKINNYLNNYKGTLIAKQQLYEENQENINQSVTDYTKEVFEKLDSNEKRDRRLAYFCYIASFLFIVVSTAFSIFKAINYNANYNLQQTIHYLISNILTLTLMVALSRLSFVLGKSFMVESIRNGDRIHAISFGKFFLNAYGNVATRDEIREVFQNWNIDKGSSFRTQDTKDFDPQILNALDVIKSAIKK